MLEVIFGVAIAICAAIIYFFGKKGWIELPQSKEHLEFMAMFAVIFLFGLGAGIYYAGSSSIICLGPLIIFCIIGFAVGFTYYQRRQKKGSDVQTLNLDK